MLQLDAAGSGDDDEMVFELLHDRDAVFGDVGEVIEEEGVECNKVVSVKVQ